ncbi:FUSC family protein [Acinetobacter faecalis]|nr:FUSC family protein [Acinetobacter faecalis]MDY6469306.1 FUSC family protein [Acinetobacter faecalis]
MKSGNKNSLYKTYLGKIWDSVIKSDPNWNMILRYTLSSVLVLIISMTLEIPMIGLSLFIAFMATQSNVVLTNILAISGWKLVNYVIGAALLLIILTFNYPVLRISVCFALIFFCIYMMRTSALSLVFYSLATCIISLQQLFDLAPNGEVMIRAGLWSWVVCIYPLFICTVINSLFIPVEPLKIVKKSLHMRLSKVLELLNSNKNEMNTTGFDLATIENAFLNLRTLLQFAWVRNPLFKRNHNLQLDYISTVVQLEGMIAKADVENFKELSEGEIEILNHALKALDNSIQTETRFNLEKTPEAENLHIHSQFFLDFWYILFNFERRAKDFQVVEGGDFKAMMKPPILRSDTWTNPIYTEYALKTMIGILLAYIFYNGMDWVGIHTVALTVLIASQPSLGASNDKITLRIIGALIGGGIALLLTIFLIPKIETIVGLILACVPVFMLSAYIASISKYVNYLGVQIAFTFALAMFGGYEQNIELSSISDRLIGIGIGIGIAYLLQALLWPELSGGYLQKKVTAFLKDISNSIKPTESTPKIDITSLVDKSKSGLADINDLLSHVALEPTWIDRDRNVDILEYKWLLDGVRSFLHEFFIYQNKLTFMESKINETKSQQNLVNIQNSLADIIEIISKSFPDTLPQSDQVAIEESLLDININLEMIFKNNSPYDDFGNLKNSVNVLQEYIYRYQ